MLWIRVTTNTANHLKPTEIILNLQKPFETIQELLETTCITGTPRHSTAQRATKSYLVFLLLTLNMISQSGNTN